MNFEGLTIGTVEDVRVLADYLDRHYVGFDKRFNVIINTAVSTRPRHISSPLS